MHFLITGPKTLIWELFPIISTDYGILVNRAGWEAFIYFPHINEDRNKNEQFEPNNCSGSQSNFFYNCNHTSNTRNILLIKISIIQSKSLQLPQYPIPFPSLETFTIVKFGVYPAKLFLCVYTYIYIYKCYLIYVMLYAFFINISLRYG